jgi:predicted nuclease of predicted toxin-antitoxin system
LAIVLGPPPQVIWLKTGNESVVATLKVLLDHRADIEDALLRKEQACVELMSR